RPPVRFQRGCLPPCQAGHRATVLPSAGRSARRTSHLRPPTRRRLLPHRRTYDAQRSLCLDASLEPRLRRKRWPRIRYCPLSCCRKRKLQRPVARRENLLQLWRPSPLHCSKAPAPRLCTVRNGRVLYRQISPFLSSISNCSYWDFRCRIGDAAESEHDRLMNAIGALDQRYFTTYYAIG